MFEYRQQFTYRLGVTLGGDPHPGVSFFFAFFSGTSRSLSAWVMSSCPSCIPTAWGCQGDISILPKYDILTLLPQTAAARVQLGSPASPSGTWRGTTGGRRQSLG
jgi:hypothetical protein